jgi:polygalacturonase
VFLSISDDATIIGSHESRDYPLDPSAWALIYARDQNNIGIIGNLPQLGTPFAGGTINGNYSAYIDRYDPGSNLQSSSCTLRVIV